MLLSENCVFSIACNFLLNKFFHSPFSLLENMRHEKHFIPKTNFSLLIFASPGANETNTISSFLILQFFWMFLTKRQVQIWKRNLFFQLIHCINFQIKKRHKKSSTQQKDTLLASLCTFQKQNLFWWGLSTFLVPHTCIMCDTQTFL